jgi:hypothetical protein
MWILRAMKMGFECGTSRKAYPAMRYFIVFRLWTSPKLFPAGHIYSQGPSRDIGNLGRAGARGQPRLF